MWSAGNPSHGHVGWPVPAALQGANRGNPSQRALSHVVINASALLNCRRNSAEIVPVSMLSPANGPVETLRFLGKELFGTVPEGTDQQKRRLHEEANITPQCFVFFLLIFFVSIFISARQSRKKRLPQGAPPAESRTLVIVL